MNHSRKTYNPGCCNVLINSSKITFQKTGIKNEAISKSIVRWPRSWILIIVRRISIYCLLHLLFHTIR